MQYTATYSPDDNKLRLYASQRLDAETYARVKGAGFSWAPKQGFFVAPMWTPERADLCIELAGDIGDEDTSLAERAESRAERFDDYSGKRAAESAAASKAVRELADGIPLGQPILVGHHSEKHARRDAERIENGMRKAVKLWETSEYWTHRAQAAMDHAAYKERPDVRARRIARIEADRRKVERSLAKNSAMFKLWERIPDPDSLKRKDGEPSALPLFDKIVMNPPFNGGDDIRHILAARKLLRPGGRLVAICAGGPRQAKALEHLADLWEPLPAGTFAQAGTNVSTVLLTMEAPEAEEPCEDDPDGVHSVGCGCEA